MAVVDPTLKALVPFLDRDDAVIDGGNSYYQDDIRRAAELKPNGIHYVVEWLPKYAPELNDIERSWRDLKGHFLAHQTFADADHLDRAIHKGIADLNQERQSPLCTNLRIAA